MFCTFALLCQTAPLLLSFWHLSENLSWQNLNVQVYLSLQSCSNSMSSDETLSQPRARRVRQPRQLAPGCKCCLFEWQQNSVAMNVVEWLNLPFHKCNLVNVQWPSWLPAMGRWRRETQLILPTLQSLGGDLGLLQSSASQVALDRGRPKAGVTDTRTLPCTRV